MTFRVKGKDHTLRADSHEVMLVWAQAIQRARDLYASLNPHKMSRFTQRALSVDSGSALGHGLGPTGTMGTTGGKAWTRTSGMANGAPRRAVGDRASSPCLEAVIAEEDEDFDADVGNEGGVFDNDSLPEGSSVKERAHSDRALDQQGAEGHTAAGVQKSRMRKQRKKLERSPETLDLSASENFADHLRFKEKLGMGTGIGLELGQGDKTPTLPRSSSGSMHGDEEDDVNVNYDGLLGETFSENNVSGSSILSSGPNIPVPSETSPDSNKVPNSPPPLQSVQLATERQESQSSSINKVDITIGTASTDRRGSQSSSSTSTGTGTVGGPAGGPGVEKESGEEARAARKVAELKLELGKLRETETMLRETLRQRDRRLLDNDRQIAELENSQLELQQEVARLKDRLGRAGGQKRDGNRWALFCTI